MPSNVTSTSSDGLPSARDTEKADESTAKTASEGLDIEHVHVDDDPRKWSYLRKTSILCMVFCAAIAAGLTVNIINPAIKQIETDLRTTSGSISLTLSIFVVVQGSTPLLWTAISEIKGRKIVYVVSLIIAIVGNIVASEAKSVGVLIGMRIIQAIGTSAVWSVGAATLADIYEHFERGTKLGIYYAAPLLGPSIGPILGGVLTQAFSWRATFWFLAAYLGVNLVPFVFFFRDTFRKERSLTYQRVLASRRRAASKRSSVVLDNAHALDTKSEGEGEASGSSSGPAADTVASPQAGAEITLSLKDVNPFPPLWLILKRWNNVAILLSSGPFAGFSYSLSYTCSRTLGNHYNYDPLKIGLVLLSYGIGCTLGTVIGGRWSDREIRRLTIANDGHYLPEMRLESTKPAMVLLPPFVIAYAWLAQKHVHIASLCTVLFFIGFFSIWVYSSTLAYSVDANPGRSSAAVAANSFVRGFMAFVFTEAAVPLQDALGDGGLYTLWAGILVVCELLFLLIRYRGAAWREAAEERERSQS